MDRFISISDVVPQGTALPQDSLKAQFFMALVSVSNPVASVLRSNGEPESISI